MNYKEIEKGGIYTAKVNHLGEKRSVRIEITSKRQITTYFFVEYAYLDGYQAPISRARHGCQYCKDGEFEGISQN